MIPKLATRRLFLAGGLGLIQPRMQGAVATDTYRFTTSHCDIRVCLEFHDRYSNRGLWLHDRINGPFCLSLKGEQNRNCPSRFIGSLAIARYEIRPRAKQHPILMLREYVRTIDRDERLDLRPPFDRKLILQNGIASDIQAFGYEEQGAEPATPDSAAPWYYFRQDLYLGTDARPFLIVHWKHTLHSIRMIDMIPGEGTFLMNDK